MGPTPTPNGNDKAVVPKPNCGMLLLSSSSSCSFLLTHAKKPLLDHIHRSLLRFWHAFASQYSKPLHQFQTLCRQQLIRCTSSRNNNNNKEKWLSNAGFAAVLPGDSVAGLVVANGISNFLNLYNTVLIVRLVLTWFPNAPPAIVAPLSTVCDPYLNIFRGLIPPLGGTLDLSPILAFLVLNAFTSTAAALPAELPTVAESHLTASRKKWMTRLQGSHSTTTTTTATKSSAQDY